MQEEIDRWTDPRLIIKSLNRLPAEQDICRPPATDLVVQPFDSIYYTCHMHALIPIPSYS